MYGEGWIFLEETMAPLLDIWSFPFGPILDEITFQSKRSDGDIINQN